jgi:hypothetical protein
MLAAFRARFTRFADVVLAVAVVRPVTGATPAATPGRRLRGLA